MKTYLLAVLLLMSGVLTRWAQAAPEASLYDGKDAEAAHLSIAPWGAGSGQESAEVYLFGGHSLKVTTLDLYQGAQIAFAAPVALNVGEAGRVLQITLRRGAATLHYDPRTLPGAAPPRRGAGAPGDGQPGSSYPGGGNYPGGGGYPGGPPQGMGFPGGNSPSGNYPGGGGGRRGGGRRRGNPGGTTADTSAQPIIPPINNLRLAFTLADGRQADILRPIPETSDPALGEGWYSVNVPLSALKFAPGGDAALKALTVGGDHYGVFYIGRIRLATDTAPITASIDGPDKAAPGAPVTLGAKADGGLSNLSYAWDFGTGGETGSGLAVSTRFPEAGQEYTVTLTVSDADGMKKPVTATKTITVSEEAPQTQPGRPGNFPGAPQGGFPGPPPQGTDPRDQRNE